MCQVKEDIPVKNIFHQADPGHKSHHEVQWALLSWPQSGSLDPLLDGSSDPNPLKKVSGLILRNHVQALKDLCFQDTIHISQMSYNRLGFSVYQPFTVQNVKSKMQKIYFWQQKTYFPSWMQCLSWNGKIKTCMKVVAQ